MKRILSLPTELIGYIFYYLDYRDLLSCTQVCSNFNTLIQGTSPLKYKIGLAIRGKKDGPRKTAMSSAGRLARLDKHTSAWKNLKWSREITIPMEDGTLWEIFGGVLVQSTNDNRLKFWQLPSDLRGIEEKIWTLGPDFGFTVADVAMDPLQDLLVLIDGINAATSEFCVHMRTLSAGTPHPLSQPKVLHCPYEDEFDGSYCIQIFGDLVAVLFTPISSEENLLMVWEWKTGKLLLDSVRSDLQSFSLLSNDCIIIGLVDQDILPLLVVMDLGLQVTHCLPYPPLRDHTSSLHCLQIRADPGPLGEVDNTVPFYQDNQDFIVVVTMMYTVNNTTENVIHFMSSKYLISLVKSPVDQPSGLYAWMLRHTRMYITPSSEPSYVWVCHVFGTRFVIIERAPNGNHRSAVRIYDFNQSAIRRDAQMSANSGGSGRIESTTNAIAADNPYGEDITTGLPYWTNVASLEGVLACDQDCQMMCSEDNIVIVDPELRKYTILVF
ncbi:hypothetical protein HYPSUDRAFT_37363 [Hypholoma sublateritium FD-334 SS-4]|uniref:F-box domain-containing protein n=1 Tax=Hypholoma sublateritium (strain FD-334 SS-4) TaxID=945553 RepID=A0A0D2PB91_HYPSF|nr:hypothetical protein HYPSUDRAFT_37363 [Hypholoma sublateritium FD-334 SS-4]